ncbi:MAG TPA: DsbC family protein [Variovorax sp.]
MNDAIRIVHGSGKRRLAVFSDPNCGHCKRIDKDLKAIGDVTVYMFLYPVLGDDSLAKARGVWCSKDRQKAWSDWIEAGTAPAGAAEACNTVGLQRGIELGRRYKVQGTPTLIFNDGTRVPGAIPSSWISTLLAAPAR